MVVSPTDPSTYAKPPEPQLVQSMIANMQRAMASGDVSQLQTALESQSVLIHGGVASFRGDNTNAVQPIARPAAVALTAPVTTTAVQTPLSRKPASSGVVPGLIRNPAGVISVTSCQQITSPGTYRLAADLTSADSCLNISNAHDVRLDCNGHKIVSTQSLDGAVNISNASAVSMQNCDLSANDAPGAGTESAGLWTTNVKGLTISNSQIRRAYLSNVSRGTITGTTFTGDYQQTQCSNVTLNGDSVLAFTDRPAAAAIVSTNGNNNVIENSVIDGGWNGDPTTIRQVGCDVGINLNSETGIHIVNNTIRNIWDNGIENTGLLSQAVIQNNTFSAIANSAIAGDHDNSWIDNQVIGNKASNTSQLFLLEHSHSANQAALTNVTVSFEGNTFTGNQLLSQPTFTPSWTPAASFQFNNLTSTPNEQIVSVAVGFNDFTDNNFGTAWAAPVFSLPTPPQDGGGNICGSPAFDAPLPLNCTD